MPEEDITDEGLVRSHLGGDPLAFPRLLKRHAPGVAGALEQMVGDYHLALDLCQEVFLKLFTALPRYRFEGRFRSMLYAMALNRGRDALRSKRRSRLVFLSDPHAEGTSGAGPDSVDEVDRRSRIEAAIQGVRSPYREALYLHDVAGLDYEAAARSLGCAVGTVKSRVNRGRLAFRDLYTRLSDEDRTQEDQHAS